MTQLSVSLLSGTTLIKAFIIFIEPTPSYAHRPYTYTCRACFHSYMSGVLQIAWRVERVWRPVDQRYTRLDCGELRVTRTIRGNFAYNTHEGVLRVENYGKSMYFLIKKNMLNSKFDTLGHTFFFAEIKIDRQNVQSVAEADCIKQIIFTS